MTKPLVNVLITVYNGLPLIKGVVEHLLAQTYPNIEVIIVDDDSNDGTLAYLNSLQDPRINVFTNGKMGRGKALNFGLSKCTGKYVAVNDADDFSLPERIIKQVAFMESHPEYGLVGSNFIKEFSDTHREFTNKSLDNDSLRVELSKHSCIQHSCVMFRKSVLDEIGGYNLQIQFLYDRDIYIRVAERSKIANLPEHLVIINRHDNQYFNKTFKGMQRRLFALKYGYKAIRTLHLPKYLYLKRTLSFLLTTSIILIKWKK